MRNWRHKRHNDWRLSPDPARKPRADVDLDRLDAKLLTDLEQEVASGSTSREDADRLAATIKRSGK